MFDGSRRHKTEGFIQDSRLTVGFFSFRHTSSSSTHKAHPGYTFPCCAVGGSATRTDLFSASPRREGRLMYGYVRKCADYGVFVGFAYGLSSLASLPHLSDSFVTSPAALFQIGQTVRAKVQCQLPNGRYCVETTLHKAFRRMIVILNLRQEFHTY